MSAAGKFVAFTSGTRTIDGATGKNNKMERGSSVSANPIWEPATPNSPKQRFAQPKVNNQTGGYGQTSARSTPKNQHGITGKDGHGISIHLVVGGTSPAQVIVVHGRQVVVNERKGMH